MHSLVTTLLIGFVCSLESGSQFFLFVSRSAADSTTQLPASTLCCEFHVTDAFGDSFPWETPEKDGDGAPVPAELQNALDNGTQPRPPQESSSFP